jgi:hypothetical protein
VDDDKALHVDVTFVVWRSPPGRHRKINDSIAGSIATGIVEHLRLSNWRFHGGPSAASIRYRPKEGDPNSKNANEANGRLAAARSLPYLAAMRDPRTPEILAWLATLPLHDRLATMHAMSVAFPHIKNDRGWTARIEAVVAELKPTAREHMDILIEARRISRSLKHQLTSDEPER